MFAVVGEYESDHVFLSAESSIHILRAFATIGFKRRVYADTSQKMKILGMGCWCIMMRNKIQP